MNRNRVRELCNTSGRGTYVLYWMQASQRVAWNHALAHAIERANRLDLPVLVYFGLTGGYPEANERHYRFMLEGLQETVQALETLGIGFILRIGQPDMAIAPLLENACELIMDTGYMRIQKQWRSHVLELAKATGYIGVYQVESDVVVPVEVVSNKEEYSARTIRPKLLGQMMDYLEMPKIESPAVPFQIEMPVSGYMAFDIEALLKILDLDTSVGATGLYCGGYKEARRHLEHFLEEKLKNYPLRNHPEYDYMSNMSPYLHFGQIAPAQIVCAVHDYVADNPEAGAGAEGFLEELVVRRELAVNFVHFNPGYDKFEEMTYRWAYETMALHVHDPREYTYSRAELEGAMTHDPYWNASMQEMVKSGKMHTYMRMYWCKKILEWSEDYKTAYETAVHLNNKYFIDGRDPCSYTGIAWCFGKHDRAWKEREISGKLRYMNSNGLKRKFDMAPYVERWT